MGAWEEMDGVDFDEYSFLPDGWDNHAVWVDINHGQTPIHQLKTDHIQNIIRGLAHGKSYWQQIDKLGVLKNELKSRTQTK